MITPEAAIEYLATLGLNPPRAVVLAWLELAEGLEPCFIGAGYSDATQTLIVTYLVGLYGLAGGNQYLASQSAPSGASRSFRHVALTESWRAVIGMLRMLDKSGCTDSLIPSAPDKKSAALFVARGGCHVRDR